MTIKPDIWAERGELQRVAESFGYDLSVLEYQAQQGSMRPLDEAVWEQLENTDSFSIETGDWDHVARLSSEVGRNWEDLRKKIQDNVPIYAPIIMQMGDRYHLVSDNTRLMIARAAGKRPDVYVFTVDVA